MREILFRGKRTDNGEWAYGYLLSSHVIGEVYNEGDYELPYWAVQKHTCEVNPSTIGQYTGLTDKNGTKIFEGEYLGDWCEDDEGNEILGHYGIVTYYVEEGRWILADKDGKGNDWTLEDCALPENWGNLYSLGNIHESEVGE